MDEQKNKSIGDSHTGNRRRGEILEAAILQAAWDELSEFGYTHLTMESVAARAKTNKAVVYRRWANKAKLVIAVIHKHVIPMYPKDVPNTGNLRDDVFAFLHGIAQPLQAMGAETIHGLLVEFFNGNITSSIPHILHPGNESRLAATMMTIMQNAQMRGEVSLEKISPRIISLPADLLRYELLSTHEPISDQVVTEIVDDIFMPLVRA